MINLPSPMYYQDQQKNLNLWWQGSLFLGVLFSINTLLYFLDHRMLADEILWVKPIKFEISLIIHFITLSILAGLLSPAKRNSRLWRGMTYAVVTAGLFEALYIFLQAARGRESHYNNTTELEATMYGLMGFGALILVAGSFYLGYLLFREYQVERRNPILLSSALGLTLGSILTLVIAGYLSSFENGYTIDTRIETRVLRIPIFSWYLNGQDLRIPHFFATHMMQVIPLYGLWLNRKNMSIAGSKTRIFICTGVYSFAVVLLFVLALP